MIKPQFRYRVRIVLFFVTASTSLVANACSNGDAYIANRSGPAVPVAVNLQSCNILAQRDFQPPSTLIQAAYEKSIEAGNVVFVKNHTLIQQGDSLTFDKGHLIPYVFPGPTTAYEEWARHLGVYMWITLREGPLNGRRVCVAASMLRGKYAPL